MNFLLHQPFIVIYNNPPNDLVHYTENLFSESNCTLVSSLKDETNTAIEPTQSWSLIQPRSSAIFMYRFYLFLPNLRIKSFICYTPSFVSQNINSQQTTRDHNAQ